MKSYMQICDKVHNIIFSVYLLHYFLHNNASHGGVIRKELPEHFFTIVVSEASTPPSPPLAWSTELPLPTPKHESRQE